MRNQRSIIIPLSRTPEPTSRSTRASMTPTVMARRKIMISPIQTVGRKKDRTPVKKFSKEDLNESKLTNQNIFSINTNAPFVQNYSRIFNNHVSSTFIKPTNSNQLSFAKLINKVEPQPLSKQKQSVVIIQPRQQPNYTHNCEPKPQLYNLISFKKTQVNPIVQQQSMQLTKAGAGCKLVASLEVDQQNSQPYRAHSIKQSLQQSLLLESYPYK